MEDFVVINGTFLGKGAYGSVRLCSNKSTGRLMACKTIDKVDMDHGKNIVHRDIKPENILVSAKGRSEVRLKVADLGIALQLSPEQEKYSVLMRPRSRCGSPGYMAPEVFRKDAYGTAVDIWSVGVVPCKMLARKVPFDLPYDLQSFCKLDLSLPHWKHVPPQAKVLVSRMLDMIHKSTSLQLKSSVHNLLSNYI